MNTATSESQGSEFFGNYTHTVRLRTLDEVNHAVPVILSIIGESGEDMPPIADEGCFSVDFVTNDLLSTLDISSVERRDDERETASENHCAM
jgi:hypothetical protein